MTFVINFKKFYVNNVINNDIVALPGLDCNFLFLNSNFAGSNIGVSFKWKNVYFQHVLDFFHYHTNRVLKCIGVDQQI